MKPSANHPWRRSYMAMRPRLSACSLCGEPMVFKPRIPIDDEPRVTSTDPIFYRRGVCQECNAKLGGISPAPHRARPDRDPSQRNDWRVSWTPLFERFEPTGRCQVAEIEWSEGAVKYPKRFLDYKGRCIAEAIAPPREITPQYGWLP